jgi:hypothetical protein
MFSRSFCGTRLLVSKNQDFLAFGSLDSVETECANKKMGGGGGTKRFYAFICLLAKLSVSVEFVDFSFYALKFT